MYNFLSNMVIFGTFVRENGKICDQNLDTLTIYIFLIKKYNLVIPRPP